MRRWCWMIGASLLVGCPTEADPDTGAAVDAATSLDALIVDAPALDAPGIDAFDPDDAHVVGLDAPGMDAPEMDATADDATASDAGGLDAHGVGSDAPATSDPRILDLSVGGAGTCVVDRRHRLWCWSRGAPVQVETWMDVTAVEVGHASICALRPDGLWCWGDNDALGASPVATPTRITLPLPLPITSFAVGGQFVCATAADGTHCWGTSLGALDSDGVAPIATLPATVALAASEGSACAIDSTGALRCWGLNANGRLGDGTILDRRRPVLISSITEVLDVQLGVQSGCAGAASGGWCWGWNGTGNLGDGTVTESHTPVAVLGGPYVAVAQGWYHGVGLRSDGSLWQWGLLRGSSSVTPVLAPERVVGVPPATRVEAGADHSCALARDGEVYCWGLGGSIGRPGGASLEGLRVVFPCEPACPMPDECVDGVCVPPPPPPPTGDAGVAGARVVSLQDRCAVHATGLVTCWGDGWFGDGTPRMASGTTPRVASIGGAVEVAAGDNGACVLLGDGSVFCWGSNAQGEVGDGTSTERRLPTRVLGLPPIAHIDGRYRRRAAVGVDGSLWMWGEDTEDRARTGTGGNRPTPVRVASVTDVVDGVFGHEGFCTLHTGGVVRCWPQTLGAPEPIETIVSDPTITSITGGLGYACALGDEVRCWGNVPGYGTRTADPPIPGFAGARAACGAELELIVVDSFGDTYYFPGGIETAVAVAATCQGRCVITETDEVRCSSGRFAEFVRRRTL